MAKPRQGRKRSVIAAPPFAKIRTTGCTAIRVPAMQACPWQNFARSWLLAIRHFANPAKLEIGIWHEILR